MTDWLKRDCHEPFDLLAPGTPPTSVALTDQLQNPGVHILNDTAGAQETTVIVVGLPRSGTSMVSVALHKLGIFMGDQATSPVFEDIRLAEVMEQNGDPQAIIGDYNQRHATWAFKRPMAFQTIERHIHLFRNPRLVVPFRDPVAVAKRQEVSMVSEFRHELQQSVGWTTDLMNFALRQAVPTMLVSYEKALADPLSFVDVLFHFVGGDVPRHLIFCAAEAIKSSPVEYLQKSQIRIPQQAFQVP